MGGSSSTSSSGRSGGVHPAAPPLHVPPVHGARRRRHHRGGHGGRPDLSLHDGGVRVDAERRGPACPGFAAGQVAAGMHGANRSAELAFGPARLRSTRRRLGGPTSPRVAGRHRSIGPRSTPVVSEALAPFDGRGAEPLRSPALAAGDHAGARRDHPHRARARAGPGEARELKQRPGEGPGRAAARAYNPGGTWPPISPRC